MAFLHASFSGYFPFCIKKQEEPPDPLGYPVAMSLKDAMALFWKTKTFRIIESWNTSAQPPFPTTVVGLSDVTLDTNREKMSELVCPSFYTEASGFSGPLEITRPLADPPTKTINDIFFISMFEGQHPVIEYNELYYPQFTFRRQGQDYLNVDWSSGISGNYYNATLAINGTDYDFPMGGPNDQGPNNCSSVISINTETSAE